ncbi:hypothetical protein ACO0LC_10710 [Undibacterium sp. JH2W]|uniref:hypothetical protein n=1 Tax=Undibacterium sp. JH2W TaxID=3413037 RepID=UPI003BF241E7
MQLRRSLSDATESGRGVRVGNAMSLQLEAYNTRRIASFTSVEAETYILLLSYLSNLTDPPPIGASVPYTLVLEGRDRARGLAARFASEQQVRCAWLDSELHLANNRGLVAYDPQIKQGKKESEAALAAFLEDVLAGKEKVSTDFSYLRYKLGQLYVDQGFVALNADHDLKVAGDKFEAGGRYLVLSAAQTRNVNITNNWHRYNYGISRLQTQQQLPILRRLRNYANELFAEKLKLSETEMCAYTFVLNTFAEAALRANQDGEAVPALQKYNELLHRLRLLDRRNENYETSEVTGFYSLAEVYARLGKTRDARQQYRLAIEAASQVSEGSKNLLEADGFLLEVREKAASNIR